MYVEVGQERGKFQVGRLRTFIILIQVSFSYYDRNGGSGIKILGFRLDMRREGKIECGQLEFRCFD